MADRTIVLDAQECEDARTALAEAAHAYHRLAGQCRDVEAMADQKKIWTEQAERFRRLVSKFL